MIENISITRRYKTGGGITAFVIQKYSLVPVAAVSLVITLNEKWHLSADLRSEH